MTNLTSRQLSVLKGLHMWPALRDEPHRADIAELMEAGYITIRRYYVLTGAGDAAVEEAEKLNQQVRGDP